MWHERFAAGRKGAFANCSKPASFITRKSSFTSTGWRICSGCSRAGWRPGKIQASLNVGDLALRRLHDGLDLLLQRLGPLQAQFGAVFSYVAALRDRHLPKPGRMICLQHDAIERRRPVCALPGDEYFDLARRDCRAWNPVLFVVALKE